jgi:beta-lactam-binding protein with PASTA domain
MKQKKSTIFGSIASKPLWVNILLGLGLSVLVFFIFFQMLEIMTQHGAYLRVPDVKGRKVQEAKILLENEGFTVLVQDSLYYDTIAPMTILKQFPDPDATVKVNRTIYLTVNRQTPPIVPMPNLLGMSFRNAVLELKAVGLKLGDTSYMPDIAKNAVKDQQVGGSSIRAGTAVPMGTLISLVLGAGIGNEDMPVPDLFGLTYTEAMAMLDASGITLGVVLPDADLTDTAAGFVYWQNPDRYTEDKVLNRIRAGQMMDIKLTVIKPERQDSVIEVISREQSGANDF